MSELLNHVDPAVVAEFDRLREDCGIVEMSDLSLIFLTGEDRKGWLQGQATNNLRSMDHGASSAFCLCEPTGQIVSVCDLWSVNDRFLLTTSHKHAHRLYAAGSPNGGAGRRGGGGRFDPVQVD